MRRLPRRLALWGGAAAIAGGGFAFMASNNVLLSSAGEGVNHVSGYTISHESYKINNHLVNGNNKNAGIEAVTFTVTSTATTSNANTKPLQVWVYLEYASGATIAGHNHGSTTVGCTAWTTTTYKWHITGGGTTGNGTGRYTCRLTTQLVVTTNKIDVEVSQ